jgi:WhiB family redox-sensing transcriptional regulator
MSDYDWCHSAACLEHDMELFFPVGNNARALAQAEEAKAVCQGCPVIDTCLSWALDTGQAGVWGATSEGERRALKRRDERAKVKVRDQAGEGVIRPREFPVRGVLAPGLGIGRPL